MNEEIRYTISLKDLLTSKIRGAAKDTERLNETLNETEKASKRAAKGFMNMGNAGGNAMSSIGRLLGIGIGVESVRRFGISVKDALVNYQYFSASLRTLMKGDEQTAKALQTQLVSLAKETPFSLNEIQDATKQLLAYGFSAGDVTKNIRMLGDVASALKIPFSDIAYIYGTLKTQGRAYARDIMQFTQRGIPVIKELAKQFNVTEAEVSKMVEQGKVGFKDVEKAFISMTSQGGMFFKMMEQQSQTVGGRISNLADSWEQLLVQIGKSKTGTINFIVKGLGTITTGIAENLSADNYVNEVFSAYGIDKTFAQKYLPEKRLRELGGTALDYEEAAATSRLDALRIVVQREKELFALQEQRRKGEITAVDFMQESSILMQNIKNIRGIANTFNKKGEATAGTPTAPSSLEGGTAGKPEAPKYTQIHINISEMKAAETIEISDAKTTDYRVISDKVMEMMAGALNDSQRMAVH